VDLIPGERYILESPEIRPMYNFYPYTMRANILARNYHQFLKFTFNAMDHTSLVFLLNPNENPDPDGQVVLSLDIFPNGGNTIFLKQKSLKNVYSDKEKLYALTKGFNSNMPISAALNESPVSITGPAAIIAKMAGLAPPKGATRRNKKRQTKTRRRHRRSQRM